MCSIPLDVVVGPVDAMMQRAKPDSEGSPGATRSPSHLLSQVGRALVRDLTTRPRPLLLLLPLPPPTPPTSPRLCPALCTTTTHSPYDMTASGYGVLGAKAEKINRKNAPSGARSALSPRLSAHSPPAHQRKARKRTRTRTRTTAPRPFPPSSFLLMI